MHRLFSRLSAAIAPVAAITVLGFGLLGTTPALSTVAQAPRLVQAILNGSPVNVLYVTRSSDTVLVRCYPGFEPSLTVRAMGTNTEQMEGVLTCGSRQ